MTENSTADEASQDQPPPGTPPPNRPSLTRSTEQAPENKIDMKVLFIAVGALVAAILIGALVAPSEPNSGFVSAAAVLTFVTAAAVGIERIVEGFFAFVDRASNWGGWWPLKQVTNSILAFEKNTKKLLEEPLAAAIHDLNAMKDAAKTADKITDEGVKTIEANIKTYERTRIQLHDRLGSLEKLAPGSPRFDRANEVSVAATATLDEIAKDTARLAQTLKDDVTRTADALTGACNEATDVVTAFSDNPARKVLSLILGSVLGIAIASFMGLNLFLAIVDDPDSQPAGGACDDQAAACLDGKAGVVVTGVIIGLGANPTHEVIAALRRRRRKDTEDDEDGRFDLVGGYGFNALGITQLGGSDIHDTYLKPNGTVRAIAPPVTVPQVRRRRARPTG
jgi:hypothetical protein